MFARLTRPIKKPATSVLSSRAALDGVLPLCLITSCGETVARLLRGTIVLAGRRMCRVTAPWPSGRERRADPQLFETPMPATGKLGVWANEPAGRGD
jgi:hypothetical protein